MSHSDIAPYFKRYFVNSPRDKLQMLHKIYSLLPYVCLKVLIKFLHTFQKPVFRKKIPKFQSHTVTKSHVTNGTKSQFWS